MIGYMITPDLEDLVQRVEKHKPKQLLFRNKEIANYAEIALKIATLTKDLGVDLYLHQDAFLSKELGAKGVHLTSKQFKLIKQAKEMSLDVIVSTHTKDEALLASSLGADAITFSPIFHSPNKGEPVGVEALADVVKSVGIKVFALGGIVSAKDVDLIRSSGAYGFASIRYFS